MQSINPEFHNISREPIKTKSKSKDKSLDPIADATIRRSSSDESLKLESKKITTTEAKRSKRDLVKGLSSRLISPISKIRSKEEGLAVDGTTAKDTTYESEIDGNADLCHVNPKVGLIYIVDGAGHNNPVMKRDLEQLFTAFNPVYEKAMKKNKFKSLDEAKTHICNSMNSLHGMIHQMASQVAGKISEGEENPVGISFTDATYDFEVSKLPAMSFGQIVKIKGDTYFLTVQYGDTAFVLQRTDGGLDFSLLEPKQDEPLGQREIKVTRVHETLVQSGDRILASSDGIMEFMERNDFERIVRKHPTADAPELLDALKDKVIRRGKLFKKLSGNSREKQLALTDTRASETILGANNRALKTHNPEDRKLYDDLSLGVMTIN